ncbi:MAG: FAD-dependent oxidoreductase, partial [Chloroflexi bacterium]|nr:FAD-dependent oxidoreductase [Chloroflexota bacterium]
MNLPIVDRVDVVVIGGTIRGVAAAIRAAEHGSRTLLVAPGPFPGEDLCDTLRLWRPAGWDGNAESCPIAAQFFPPGTAYTTPMRVKRTLAQALLDAG